MHCGLLAQHPAAGTRPKVDMQQWLRARIGGRHLLGEPRSPKALL